MLLENDFEMSLCKEYTTADAGPDNHCTADCRNLQRGISCHGVHWGLAYPTHLTEGGETENLEPHQLSFPRLYSDSDTLRLVLPEVEKSD